MPNGDPRAVDWQASFEIEQAKLARVRKWCEEGLDHYAEDIFPPPPKRPGRGYCLVWVKPGPGIRTIVPDLFAAAMGRHLLKRLLEVMDEEPEE